MTPLPLGILALAGVTGGGPAYELLESTTLSSGASSVTFSGLSAYATDYKHLQIRAVTQINKTTDTIENVFVRLNGDTGANYA